MIPVHIIVCWLKMEETLNPCWPYVSSSSPISVLRPPSSSTSSASSPATSLQVLSPLQASFSSASGPHILLPKFSTLHLLLVNSLGKNLNQTPATPGWLVISLSSSSDLLLACESICTRNSVMSCMPVFTAFVKNISLAYSSITPWWAILLVFLSLSSTLF